jgi:hypothetical protein
MTAQRTAAGESILNVKLRRFLLYYLPLLANIGLIAYLVWQLSLVPYFQRQGEFQIFSVLYAVGGLVVAVSGITAFIHVTANAGGPRLLFALALVNTIIPTVLVLAMLQFR